MTTPTIRPQWNLAPTVPNDPYAAIIATHAPPPRTPKHRADTPPRE